jgi:hypothetical protein
MKMAGLDGQLLKGTEHDINIDIPIFRMPKCARQSADDLESEFLPAVKGRLVGGHDEIELHGAEAEPARFVETMRAHGPANMMSASGRGHHETCIGHVSAAPLADSG